MRNSLILSREAVACDMHPDYLSTERCGSVYRGSGHTAPACAAPPCAHGVLHGGQRPFRRVPGPRLGRHGLRPGRRRYGAVNCSRAARRASDGSARCGQYRCPAETPRQRRYGAPPRRSGSRRAWKIRISAIKTMLLRSLNCPRELRHGPTLRRRLRPCGNKGELQLRGPGRCAARGRGGRRPSAGSTRRSFTRRGAYGFRLAAHGEADSLRRRGRGDGRGEVYEHAGEHAAEM